MARPPVMRERSLITCAASSKLAEVGQPLDVAGRDVGLELLDAPAPWLGANLCGVGQPFAENVGGVSHDREVHGDVLVDLARVYLDIDLFGLRGKPATFPVKRSSKRIPRAMSRSASWIAWLTEASPCIPAMPR